MNSNLVREMAISIRMLLRHALTSDVGAGVPKVDLAYQIRAIDKELGGAPPSLGKKTFGKVDNESLVKMVDGELHILNLVKTKRQRKPK